LRATERTAKSEPDWRIGAGDSNGRVGLVLCRTAVGIIRMSDQETPSGANCTGISVQHQMSMSIFGWRGQ